MIGLGITFRVRVWDRVGGGGGVRVNSPNRESDTSVSIERELDQEGKDARNPNLIAA